MAGAGSLAERVYLRLPVAGQDLLCTVEGARRKLMRYSRQQVQWEDFFRRSATWSADRLEAYRIRKLRELVRHCHEQVPYYRRTFDALGLEAGDIRSESDLGKLPMLTRDDLRRAGDELLADDYPRSRLWVHRSSGSTGMPITLYTSQDAVRMDYGFCWARRRPGVTPRDPWGLFSGNVIVPPGATKPPFWRRNLAAKQTLYSIFHMKEETLGAYVEDLRTRDLTYLQGYSSAAYTVADYALRHGIRLDGTKLTAFFSTSEVLQPHFREAIEQAFGVRVWNNYGQGEMAGSITEYECGHLHVDQDYGAVELIPTVGGQGGHGGPDADGCIEAEIVCTGFHNLAWPLLRYRVGDLALYDPDERCSHRPGPVIRSIHGRTGQAIHLPDGRRLHHLMGLTIHCRNALSIQLVQTDTDRLLVHCVPAPEFTAADEAHMMGIFRSRVGPDVTLDVHLADAPLLTSRGKLLAVLNRIPATSGG